MNTSFNNSELKFLESKKNNENVNFKKINK